MGNQDKIHEILGRYLAGDASEQEKSVVIAWLQDSEQNKKEFELHEKIWEQSKIDFKAPGAEIVFKGVLNKIDDDHEKQIANSLKTEKRYPKRNLLWVAKIAASISIFLALGYFVVQSIDREEIKQEQTAIIQKQNPAGQKSKIFLPDGSAVWLNAESSISYPERFSDSLREVFLQGEAFFSVIKNPDKPFVVTAGDIVTTVLGTSFNVNAYRNEQNAYIALQSGKVKVDINNDQGSQEMYLEPGEGISYNKSSRITIKEEFDEILMLGWKDGKIKFTDASLEEVVSTLSRWYGVTVIIENDVPEQWSYYGGPFENENLDNVLESIGFAKGFTHIIDKNNPEKVSIKFN